MKPIDERIINAVVGVGMVGCGISLFVFGMMLAPYMSTLSGIPLYIIPILTAGMLGFGTCGLVLHGASVAIGHITIRVEPCGGK